MLGMPPARLAKPAPRPQRPESAPPGALGFVPIATSLGHLIPRGAEAWAAGKDKEAVAPALPLGAVEEGGGEGDAAAAAAALDSSAMVAVAMAAPEAEAAAPGVAKRAAL